MLNIGLRIAGSGRYRSSGPSSTLVNTHALATSGITSQALPFGAAVAAGSLMIVAVGWYSTTAAPTVTDSLGNTYTLRKTASHPSDTQFHIAVFESVITTAGTPTVTITWSAGANFVPMALANFAGQATFVDCQNSTPTPGNVTNASLPSVSTPSANELVIGVMEGYRNGAAITAGTGASLAIAVNGNDGIGIFWMQASSTSTSIEGSLSGVSSGDPAHYVALSYGP